MSQKHKKRVNLSEYESDEESIDVEVPKQQPANNGNDDGKSESSSESSDEKPPGALTQALKAHRKRRLQEINEQFIIKDLLMTEPSFDIATKLALVNRVKEINKLKTASNKKAINKLDWSLLDLDMTEEDAKKCLNQILKPVSPVRTLEEMLNDYCENYQKYELKNKLSAPQPPMLRWINRNRMELSKKYKKKFGVEVVPFGDLSKFGAKQYNKLSQDEQNELRKEYEEERREYDRQKKELIAENPELKKSRKKKPQEKVKAPSTSKGKSRSEPKPETNVTCFKLFWNEMKESNPEIRYQDAQSQYKNLGDREKLIYINKLINLDTELEKIFTSDEKKIMKHSSGLPVKPLSAYNTFIRHEMKNVQIGKGESAMKKGSELWKNAPKDVKKHYQEIFENEMIVWKQQMEEWIKTLPEDQQAEQYAKHNLFAIGKGKKIKNETVENVEINIEGSHVKNLIEIAEIDEARQKSPKKKKNESESTASPSKKRKGSESDVTASPSKKQKTTDDDDTDLDSIFNPSKSPSKKNYKKQLEALGPFPSTTLPHYFMTKKMAGQSKAKIKKEYNALPKVKKIQLTNEMEAIRNAYLEQVKKLTETVDPKYKKKIADIQRSNMEQQKKEISWHDGSDSEESDSDDSD